ncbi:MAG TPA: hypothetical protein VNA25_01200 [Phycisphaerae bacterium]|nr:hypothetical protein [Phycisphaerae bacterium]
MVYRIRYSDGGLKAEAEAVVEANNTTEAMVKFRHTRGGLSGTASHDAVVISICPDMAADSLPPADGYWFVHS